MKKIIIFAMFLFTSYSQAQLEVAQWNFRNGDNIDGWAIVDHDGTNGSTWALRNNFYSDFMGGEAFDVLSLTTLGGPGSANEWAILPVQDLSFYSGIHFNLSYLQGLFEAEVNMELLLYAKISETVPTIADFLTGQPVANIALVGSSNDPPTEISINKTLPATYNVENVHFALVYKWLPGQEAPGSGAIEIAKVSITADGVLNIGDKERQATVIKQNPVSETLWLTLGNGINEEDLSVELYNINGVLIKEEKYSKEGVSVSNLASGMYIVVLKHDQAVERLKFIKK